MAKNKANDHSKYRDWIDPNAVVPYERNAKEHTEKQVRNICTSIRRFGWQQDTVITSDNVLVIGHGRRLAALKLGCEMPYHRIDKAADELTDEDIRELRIADNQTNAETGFDLDVLALDTDGLEFEGFEFDFGLDEGTAEGAASFDVIEDQPPEPPEIPTAKRGDIWQLGRHRLMCGDSTDAETVGVLLDGKKADMVYTDPPYGMDLDTDYSSMVNKLEFAQGKNIKNGKKYDQGIVDDFSPGMISAVLSINSPEVFLWGANYYAELLTNRNSGSWFVWDKRSTDNTSEEAAESADKMYGSCFELCWSKKAHKQDIARVKWAGVFGKEQEFDHKRYHPTQKPIKLSAWFISKYSADGGCVVDLFGGSGSTLIACEQLNRTCYMMELDPHYCDVIIRRWESLTGEKAVLLNDPARTA